MPNDYNDKPLAVGDYARNIESGWLGRIESFYDDHDGIEMVIMTGVDELVVIVTDCGINEALSSDDTQHHACGDLRKQATKTVKTPGKNPESVDAKPAS